MVIVGWFYFPYTYLTEIQKWEEWFPLTTEGDIDVTDIFDIVHFREWSCLYH
jgi:hypothetical protein